MILLSTNIVHVSNVEKVRSSKNPGLHSLDAPVQTSHAFLVPCKLCNFRLTAAGAKIFNAKPKTNPEWFLVYYCPCCAKSVNSLPAARAAKPFSAQMILFASEDTWYAQCTCSVAWYCTGASLCVKRQLTTVIPGCEECGNTQKGAFFNSPSLLAKQSGRNITVPLHSKSSNCSAMILEILESCQNLGTAANVLNTVPQLSQHAQSQLKGCCVLDVEFSGVLQPANDFSLKNRQCCWDVRMMFVDCWPLLLINQPLLACLPWSSQPLPVPLPAEKINGQRSEMFMLSQLKEESIQAVPCSTWKHQIDWGQNIVTHATMLDNDHVSALKSIVENILQMTRREMIQHPHAFCQKPPQTATRQSNVQKHYTCACIDPKNKRYFWLQPSARLFYYGINVIFIKTQQPNYCHRHLAAARSDTSTQVS